MVSRDKAPNIEVDLALKQKARDFAEKVVKETYNRFNYDTKSRKEKIYLGKLGEEALLMYFNKFGIFGEIDYNIYLGSSNTDETDLKIGKFKLDIKVGSKPFHKRLLVVKSYFDNGHQSDFYVALNLYDNESYAIIYGFANKDEISKSPVAKWDKVNPIDDYTLLYRDLRPIEELVSLLNNN